VFGKVRHLDRPAAVMAIDLDRFKAANDAAGHAAGDAVLCKVAEACRLAVCAYQTLSGDWEAMNFRLFLITARGPRDGHRPKTIART
jgi:predicted signal transduction protein with EAL and GGDEF domain